MAPNVHFCFFVISHLCILTPITWRLQVIYGRSPYWMTALLSEIFLVGFRVAQEIQMDSYGLRHVSFILWYKMVRLNCKPWYTSLFGVQLCMTTKLMYMYLMTAYCTLNDSFTANAWCIILEEQSWLTMLHVAVSFPLIVYSNVKILINTTILLYEFAAK